MAARKAVERKADRKPGQPLALPQHEAFAQAVAEGLSAAAAYRREISNECTYESSVQAASKLMADFNVRSRVEELRSSFEEILVDRLGVKQETLARYLMAVIQTPLADVTVDHELCQEYSRTDGDKVTTEKVKMPSKLEAMKQLISMAGWNAPEKTESTTTVVVKIGGHDGND